MKRVPAPVNGSTDLVPVKAYVDAETQQQVHARAAAIGRSTSKYLSMLMLRDLSADLGSSEASAPYPTNRTLVVTANVDLALWERAAQRAKQRGRSLSKYLLELILQDQLDADGRPLVAPISFHAEALPGLEAA